MGIKNGYLNVYIGVGPTLRRLSKMTERYKVITGNCLSMSRLISSILRIFLTQNSDAKILSKVIDLNN